MAATVIIAVFEALIAFFSVGVWIIIFASVLIVALASYLLSSFGLYNMALKAGYDKPWFAFIPFVRDFLEIYFPRRKFKVLFIDTFDRQTIAIVLILMTYLGSGVIAGLNVVPAVGQLLDVALLVFLYAMNWRRKYDILATYDKQNAMLISILGTFIPIVYAFYIFKIRDMEPEFGFNNFETAEMKEDDLFTN